MTEDDHLVALVASRIAHDLVSPLGAIGNGIELMRLTGAEESPEMTLVEESLAGANARIWFFRLAFGAAEAGSVIRNRDLVQAMSSIGGRKTRLLWEGAGDPARTSAKLALLAASCLETALPKGGDIRVQGTDRQLSVTALGVGIVTHGPDWSRLSGSDGPVQLAPGRVQFALLALEARRQGRRIDLHRQDGSLTLSL